MADKLLNYQSEGVLILQINREDTGNRIDGETMQLLRASIEKAAQDNNVKGIVITGTGETFCIGGQQDGYPAGTLAGRQYFVTEHIKLHESISLSPKPIIAAVNGDAFAGGFSLLASCDLAVAAPNARFGLPELEKGLFPLLALANIIGTIPPKVALEMIYTCKIFNADEAKAFNFINKIVAKERLLSETIVWAKEICSQDSLALAIGRTTYRNLLDKNLVGNAREGGLGLLALLRERMG